MEELTSVNFERQGEREQNLFFQYSTHPSLPDRLAALPSDSTDAPKDSPPAITLLKDPDAVAETLIAEIQKRAAEEERKDSKRLKRSTRSAGINAKLRPLQSFGAFVVIIGAIGGIAAILVDGFSPGSMGFLFGGVAIGIVLFRLGRYRARLTLDVPEYSVLKKAWQKRLKFTDEEVKAMESELRAQVSAAGSKRDREMAFASLCYGALKRCDYVRAHIAARFCLEVNNKSIEGAAGFAVAAAALGQVQQAHQALNYLGKMTGMTTPGILWSAGWTLVTLSDWVPAEAFLEKLCQSKKKHPTHLFLLSLCQSKRGKMQSSLLTARLACTPAPANNEQAKFLIDLLLQLGYLREAEARLRLLEAEAGDDIEIMLLMVRLNLLLRNFAGADKWSEQMRGKQAGAHYFLRLGQYHEVARQNQKASGFYNEALAAGFYPESLLGLARLEAFDRNKEQARKHLITALNTGRELGERAVGPLPLFHQIINQMLALEDPVSNCRAWIVSLNGGKSPPGLANRALLIYANGREQAEQYFKELVFAMEPGKPPIFPSHLGWTEAEKEKQPDGPVRAGIQCVLN